MKLILGSKSEGRKRVLEEAGFSFSVMSPDIDEKAIRSEDFTELPLLLAREKARILLTRIDEPAILITSDQVVVCNGNLREKPETKTEARKFLESYNNFSAQTNTAVVVTNTKTGNQKEVIDTVNIYFKHIPKDIIDRLVTEGKVMHAAGAIIAEHPLLIPYISSIDGDITSVTGLPLKITSNLIKDVS
jgi:septum formation protein